MVPGDQVRHVHQRVQRLSTRVKHPSLHREYVDSYQFSIYTERDEEVFNRSLYTLAFQRDDGPLYGAGLHLYRSEPGMENHVVEPPAGSAHEARRGWRQAGVGHRVGAAAVHTRQQVRPVRVPHPELRRRCRRPRARARSRSRVHPLGEAGLSARDDPTRRRAPGPVATGSRRGRPRSSRRYAADQVSGAGRCFACAAVLHRAMSPPLRDPCVCRLGSHRNTSSQGPDFVDSGRDRSPVRSLLNSVRPDRRCRRPPV